MQICSLIFESVSSYSMSFCLNELYNPEAKATVYFLQVLKLHIF